jgi:hypothetical protein
MIYDILYILYVCRIIYHMDSYCNLLEYRSTGCILDIYFMGIIRAPTLAKFWIIFCQLLV